MSYLDIQIVATVQYKGLKGEREDGRKSPLTATYTFGTMDVKETKGSTEPNDSLKSLHRYILSGDVDTAFATIEDAVKADAEREKKRRAASAMAALCLPRQKDGEDEQIEKEEDSVAESYLYCLVNEADKYGFTPLSCAASLQPHKAGHGMALILCKQLLSHGAEVHVVDFSGNSALHWAAYAGNTEVVGLLADRGCPLNNQNDDGDTALHYASRYGRTATVKALVAKGAQQNIRNKANHTPLEVAISGIQTGKMRKKRDVDMLNAKRQSIRKVFYQHDPSCRTAILYHNECLQHRLQMSKDWECPERLTDIISTLLKHLEEGKSDNNSLGLQSYEVDVSDVVPRTSVEALRRVHTPKYIRSVHDIAERLKGKADTVQQNENVDGTEEMRNTDGYRIGSLLAARRLVLS
jgi:hypothetical protein